MSMSTPQRLCGTDKQTISLPMGETFTLHDFFLWVGLLVSVLGLLLAYGRSSKSHAAERRAEIVEIAKWRTNIERDIKDVVIEQSHHSAHDGAVLSKLTDIGVAIDDLKSRTVRIETILSERSERSPF